MSNVENKNLPAYPASGSWNDNQPGIITVIQEGLTKRELACIKLGVADTGDEYLDTLILKAERKRIAAMEMQGLCASGRFSLNPVAMDVKNLIERSLECADELLNQLSKPIH